MSSSLFEPVQSQSLVDMVTLRLEEAIFSGALPPGSRITEQSLAASLMVSRGPLREAIRRLEGRRLVDRRPNVGVRVAMLSREDLNDLLEIREALEGMACRLAAQRMPDEEIGRLASLLEDHAGQPELRDGKIYYQDRYDNDFHFRIINASGNQRLIASLVNDIYDLLRLYRTWSSKQTGRAQLAWEEHMAIVEALRSRDPDRAEAAMRHHIAQARLSVESVVLPDPV